MPTVEADVAFGLGKFNLTLDEVRSRVESALDAVGMLEYLRVSYKHMKKLYFLFKSIVYGFNFCCTF